MNNKVGLNVAFIPSVNEEMKAAILEAKKNINYFIECLANPRPQQSGFAIKARINENEEVEHIWLIDVRFNGLAFEGIVSNEPVLLTQIKKDSWIQVNKEDVSDWMILENHFLTGGFTVLAQRKMMDENERQRFDANTGFLIEEYYESNFETPEGALLCLEQAYNQNNLDLAVQCKDFKMEGRMLLERQLGDLSMLDEDMINNIAQALEVSFRQTIKHDGYPQFTNIRRAFPEKKKVEENLWLLTEVVAWANEDLRVTHHFITKTEKGFRVAGQLNIEE